MLYITLVGVLLLGGFLGYFGRVIIARFQRKSLETDVQEIMLKARTEAQKIVSDAEARAEKVLSQSRELETTREKDFKTTQEHL